MRRAVKQVPARRFPTSQAALAEAVCLGVIAAGPALSDAEQPPSISSPETAKPSLSASLNATRAAPQPLNLLLTQSELIAVVRNYERKTGEIHTAPFADEEILVTAPGYLAPMRDSSQDVAGGIVAPFWAIMHPKDAWRIFVPIPPKGASTESERPAPDPR